MDRDALRRMAETVVVDVNYIGARQRAIAARLASLGTDEETREALAAIAEEFDLSAIAMMRCASTLHGALAVRDAPRRIRIPRKGARHGTNRDER